MTKSIKDKHKLFILTLVLLLSIMPVISSANSIEDDFTEEKDSVYLTGGNNINLTTEDVTYKVLTELNMRTGPSIDYGVILSIPAGKEVVLIEKYNDWYEVKYGDVKGFCSDEYLEEVESIVSEWKDDEDVPIDPVRYKIVDEALKLVEKVPYFWGGKSTTIGWNDNWNKLRKITSPGTSSYGKVVPFGLDCSGFIDWAYRTAGAGDMFSHGGTGSQWSNSYEIGREDLLIGDVAFKQSPDGSGINHIGIYIGKDAEGEELFIHSSASKNGVVVTNARGGSLKHFRRANVFK